MKLFAWEPKGHGQLSFFVMAENITEAYAAVDKYIVEHHVRDFDDDDFSGNFFINDYEVAGWKTDYYKLIIVEAGEVLFNYNE